MTCRPAAVACGIPAPVAAETGARPAGPRLSHGAAAALLVAALALARFLYAWPLELLPDEAYHAVLGERPAFGYFDHPPLLMWLLGLSTSILGKNEAAVRIVPIALGAWSAFFVFRLASRVFTGRVAFWTVVLLSTTLLFAGGTVLAVPDVPLILALTAASYHFHRALTDARTRDWLLTGAWAGLGMLSKYSAVLWLVSFASCLALPENRRWLTRWQPFVALAIAMLLFAPVVAWNARHGWASFAFQLDRGVGPGQFPRWLGPVEFLGGQALMVGPLTLVALLAVLISAAGSWSSHAHGTRFLWVFASVPLGAFLCASLFRHSEANWPCLAYPPGLVLLAGACVGGTWSRRRGAVYWPWIVVSNTILLLVALALVYAPASPASERADDFFGWRALASQIEAMAQARPDLAVAADRYQVAGELAFYTGRPVTCFNIRSRPNQFDLWRDEHTLAGRNFLLVDTGPVETTKTAARFGTLRLLQRLMVGRGPRRARELFVYEAIGYRPVAAGPFP